jgi:hypothetical protein
MTPETVGRCISLTSMPTERVTLDMDATALYAARVAAGARNVSLADWLSQVARERAIWETMALSAEQERLHPDEPPGWAKDAEDRIFGDTP